MGFIYGNFLSNVIQPIGWPTSCIRIHEEEFFFLAPWFFRFSALMAGDCLMVGTPPLESAM